LIFALSAFWIFFVHSRTVAHPLFEKEMLANRAFLVGLGFMTIMGIANIGLSAVLPTMYQTVYSYSVMDTGLLMAPRGCGVDADVTAALVLGCRRHQDPAHEQRSPDQADHRSAGT
ncbi:MAG: hypothetical protein RLZZ584_1407, partial [Pseudomonadota bacterium]